MGPSQNGLSSMCDTCVEIDRKIERYRAILARILDAQMNEGLTQLIDKMLAQKALLHPEQQG